jgi:hypothetical protein
MHGGCVDIEIDDTSGEEAINIGDRLSHRWSGKYCFWSESRKELPI